MRATRPAPRRRVISFAVFLTLFALLFWWQSQAPATAVSLSPMRLQWQFQGRWEKRFTLQRGETVELSVGLPTPSTLPRHGRVGVRWTLVEAKDAATLPALLERKPDAFGIYTKPTADWQKVLHALDADLYLVYRAPVS